MSKIEVNQIDTISGSSTLLVGPSAATKLTFSSTLTVDFNVNSPGVTLGADMKMTPAFEASLSSDQTISNNTVTKVQFNTEDLDTDGCYDNSTNYRFTPTVAGKYYVYSFLTIGQGSTVGIAGQIYIRKNGSTIRETQTNVYSNSVLNLTSLHISSIVDMNGSTDYLEIFGLAEVTSGSPRFEASSGFGDCVFGGYKVIGT